MEKGKRELTIEELEKQIADLNEASKALNETLVKKKKEEKERKEAQLSLEKETRKKEVDDALENYRTLVSAYIRDYGAYKTISTTDSYPWSLWF